MEYKLTWKIEIDADSPREAAEVARAYQLDRKSEVGCFEVSDSEGNVTVIDLDLDSVERKAVIL